MSAAALFIRMMFCCCHPRLREEAQVALVLQILYGFSVNEIASAFVSAHAAIEKRITRAKKMLSTWHYLVSWLTGVYIWALLTPVILWAGRRFPIERRNWLRRTAIHLLFSMGFAIIQLALESAVPSRVGVFPSVMRGFLSTFLFLLVIGFHSSIVTYFVVLGIQSGFRYYR